LPRRSTIAVIINRMVSFNMSLSPSKPHSIAAFAAMSASMKSAAKAALSPAVKRVRWLMRESTAMDYESYCQQTQRSIVNQYLVFREQSIVPYHRINDAGFRAYSQFEEDGIILYILSMIGFKTKRVVEMCCGSGDECMATNLILNHGFDGYLFDGSEAHVDSALTFFRSKKECLLLTPTITHAWITVENVNELLTRSGCVGEIDLFALDMHGNDYGVWKAIEIIQPRLMVFETHNVIPGDRSLTIGYRPDFCYLNSSGPEKDYLGASLLAMVKLCRKRGYRL